MTVRNKLTIILLIIIALFICLAALAWFSYKSGALQRTVETQIINQIATSTPEQDFIKNALGFYRPRTYLLLFLNNTELRPGGGFIGSYAVVKFNKGLPEVLKVEGSEVIDNAAPKNIFVPPPAPIANYLKLSKWYFRDSNWSPDFASSSIMAINLYRQENGFAGSEIEAVVGITPTVAEEILKITGPITVNSLTYTSQNITEKLEYEVEYGFAARGVEFSARKQALSDLFKALIPRVFFGFLTKRGDYVNLMQRMFLEKQLVAYSLLPTEEDELAERGWDGRMSTTTGDYILWVDANLGALKTDLAINRSLVYQISSTNKGFVATISETIKHEGKFDWRTSRYRDYARVFVPLGSKLLSSSGAMKTDRSAEVGVVDQGVENGKQWFGAFISVEPGKTGTLSFTYLVAPKVASQISSSSYQLVVQKQIGTIAVPLTLQLNFGKNVVSANPPEEQKYFGDTKYDFRTDLRTDREFEVKLNNL